MNSDVQTSCLCRVEKSITTLMTSKFLFLNKISHKLDGAVQYVWCSPPACLQSWLGFNLAGMPAMKLCDGFSCRGRMFSFVQDVSQAVPVAMLQIHRQHMRIRLYTCNLGELHMYLKSNTLNNATKGANWLKVWTMGQIGYLHNSLFDIINMD